MIPSPAGRWCFAMSIGEIGTLLPNFAFAALTPHLHRRLEHQQCRCRLDRRHLRLRLYGGRSSPDEPDRPHRCAPRLPRRRRAGGRIAHLGFACWRPMDSGRRFFWRGACGVGLAGTYMPGLEDPDRPRRLRREVALGLLLHRQLFRRRQPVLSSSPACWRDAFGWRIGHRRFWRWGRWWRLLIALVRRRRPSPERRARAIACSTSARSSPTAGRSAISSPMAPMASS